MRFDGDNQRTTCKFDDLCLHNLSVQMQDEDEDLDGMPSLLGMEEDVSDDEDMLVSDVRIGRAAASKARKAIAAADSSEEEEDNNQAAVPSPTPTQVFDDSSAPATPVTPVPASPAAPAAPSAEEQRATDSSDEEDENLEAERKGQHAV